MRPSGALRLVELNLKTFIFRTNILEFASFRSSFLRFLLSFFLTPFLRSFHLIFFHPPFFLLSVLQFLLPFHLPLSHPLFIFSPYSCTPFIPLHIYPFCSIIFYSSFFRYSVAPSFLSCFVTSFIHSLSFYLRSLLP